MIQDLGDADDCQIFGINNRIASRRAHAISAHAEEVERSVRSCASQRVDKLCSVHFTGSLSCRDEDAHADIVKAMWRRTHSSARKFLFPGRMRPGPRELVLIAESSRVSIPAW